jgi:hypothetical protein
MSFEQFFNMNIYLRKTLNKKEKGKIKQKERKGKNSKKQTEKTRKNKQ